MPTRLKTALLSLYVYNNNGVRFLASTLRRVGRDVIEIYFKDYVYHHFVPPTEKEYRILIDLLQDQGVGFLGISMRAGAYLPVAKEITQRVKTQLSIPVAWGGVHVSMAPEECIDHADFLVLGEAEGVIDEIVGEVEAGRDVSAVDNVWMKDERGVIKNSLRPLCEDLDTIPFRDFHSTDRKFFIRKDRLFRGEPEADQRMYLALASRGCVHNCAFCNVSIMRNLYKGRGRYYRFRSVENVIQELEYAKRHLKKLKRVRFDDQVFITDHAWIAEFADQYPKRIGLPFEILSDPRAIDEGSIKTLAGAGMDMAVVGVQSTGSANKRLYSRFTDDQRVLDLAQMLKRHRVMGVFQVIVDDPETTREERDALLELLLSLPRPFVLFIFSLCHWPNTARTQQLLEKGLIERTDVEGPGQKALRQFLADFSHPRKPEENFYLALYQLTNKTGFPRSWIRRMARSEKLRENPGSVMLLARTLSLAKLFLTGFRMLVKGEISLNLLRSRWDHFLSSPSI